MAGDKTSQLRTFEALAEPNRLRIVELLRDGPLPVGEIARRLEMRQPQASKHLKVLTGCGLLSVTVQGNRRIYALRPEPFLALDEWLHRIRRTMEERFENLDAYLRRLQSEESSKQHGTPT